MATKFDVVIWLDSWLDSLPPSGRFDMSLERDQVQRIRDEIQALRDDLTMARADWNNEIDKRKQARAEALEEAAQACDRLGETSNGWHCAMTIRTLRDDADKR